MTKAELIVELAQERLQKLRRHEKGIRQYDFQRLILLEELIAEYSPKKENAIETLNYIRISAKCRNDCTAITDILGKLNEVIDRVNKLYDKS